MKKLWMIAGSALVMSACSDNVAEMNPAPAGNNNFVTLAEISASVTKLLFPAGAGFISATLSEQADITNAEPAIIQSFFMTLP